MLLSPHHDIFQRIGITLHIVNLLWAELFDSLHLFWCQVIFMAGLRNGHTMLKMSNDSIDKDMGPLDDWAPAVNSRVLHYSRWIFSVFPAKPYVPSVY